MRPGNFSFFVVYFKKDWLEELWLLGLFCFSITDIVLLIINQTTNYKMFEYITANIYYDSH